MNCTRASTPWREGDLQLDRSHVAEQDRLALVDTLFERVHSEMAPGDALFFHSNLLHASGPNESAHDRRAFNMCCNAPANPQPGNPARTQLSPCPVSADDAILRGGL